MYICLLRKRDAAAHKVKVDCWGYEKGAFGKTMILQEPGYAPTRLDCKRAGAGLRPTAQPTFNQLYTQHRTENNQRPKHQNRASDLQDLLQLQRVQAGACLKDAIDVIHLGFIDLQQLTNLNALQENGLEI
jgi:hypothetical protein